MPKPLFLWNFYTGAGHPASHFCAPAGYPGEDRRPDPRRGRSPSRHLPMTDLLLLALGLGFFGLMAAYAAACDRI